MKKITLVFLTDPGHGWLKVKKTLVAELGLQISPYSYHRNNHVYLEEDCDAPKLLTALKSRNVTVKIKNKNTNRSSKIREYHSFHQV